MLAAVVLLALIPLALTIDVPVARFCLADRIPGDLQRVLGWSEVMAHGLGVALIAVLLFVLHPAIRRYLPRLLVLAYGAGLVADTLKLLVARERPRYLQPDSGVFDTVAGWLPLLNPIDGHRLFHWDSRWLSFPSAHTAVAVGLAVGLARVYPRGRFLFVLFALLAAGQRIETGAHFVSDTLAGALVGVLFAILVTERKLLGGWFDRIEVRNEW